jgi:hypothetical protein
LRLTALSVGVLSALACSAPLTRTAPPVALQRSERPAPPAPLELVVTGHGLSLAKNWPPHGHLLDQHHVVGEQLLRLDGRAGRGDLSFNAAGTSAVVGRGDVLSVWRQTPQTGNWNQVLLEPWRHVVHRIEWRGDDLLLCGTGGGVIASFAAVPTEWKRVDRAECKPTMAPQANDDDSLDGKWTLRVSERQACGNGMTGCWFDGFDSELHGPNGRVIRVAGGRARPALAPSGRGFAYLDVNAQGEAIAVMDTMTKRVRLLGARNGPGHIWDSLTWLNDESELAVLDWYGGVDLLDAFTGKKISGWLVEPPQNRRITVNLTTGRPSVENDWTGGSNDADRDPPSGDSGEGSLPADATNQVALDAIDRTAATGKGAWALWDRKTGKALRVLDDTLSFEVSPSGKYIGVLRSQCEEAPACVATAALVDGVTGSVLGTVELAAATEKTKVQWFGPPDHEFLAVMDRTAHYLRASDGAAMYAEPATGKNEQSTVLWTETGLVDGSDVELGAWGFRPAGHLDVIVDARQLRHPGLWEDFVGGKPLTSPTPIDAAAH